MTNKHAQTIDPPACAAMRIGGALKYLAGEAASAGLDELASQIELAEFAAYEDARQHARMILYAGPVSTHN